MKLNNNFPFILSEKELSSLHKGGLINPRTVPLDY